MRCWYSRWKMSAALDDGDLEVRLRQGHAARCAACQAHGRLLASLHTRLAAGARTAPVPAIAPRSVRRRLLIAGPIAVGAAAVFIAITGIRPIDPPTRSTEPPIATTDRAPGGGSNPLFRVRDVADQVSRVLGNTPLDTELDDLIADGKRGLDAVLSFGGLR
jgi:hypothetical protein